MIPHTKIAHIKAIGFILFFLFSSNIWSQQNGFNYKAIIKDNLGNVVANETITLQLTVFIGNAQIYQETHTPTTNISGLVNIIIGTGTTSDSFESIEWSNQNHTLNTQVDIGTGLVDLGTVPFNSVPYAAFAEKSTGLTPLDEGNGQGWRLSGNNQLRYSSIGNNAVDLSYSNLVLLEGDERGAAGDYSIAMGEGTTALGIASTATGNNTQALGNYSMAMGRITKAESFASVVLGRYNIGGGTTNSWQPLDPLFEIGNGDSNSNRSNALTVFKNGTITAPSFDLSEITDDKALITKEYADTNLVASGLEAIDEGNGVGWRLIGQNPNNYGNIGENAVDLSYSDLASDENGASGENSIALGQSVISSSIRSLAFGFQSMATQPQAIALGSFAEATGQQSIALGTSVEASDTFSIAAGIGSLASGRSSIALGDSVVASGPSSIALGDSVVASGDRAVAFGRETVASGGSSTALGSETTASNIGATSMGSGTLASGRSATATGRFTRAQAFSSLALGRYNIGDGDAEEWMPTDPLLEVGNGTDDANRSNAMTVLKNGDTGIGGNPNANLHVFHGINAGNDGLKIESTGANTNYWRMYTVNSTGNLNLFSKLNGTTTVGNFNDATGAYSATSDRRLKKDFKPLPFSWKKFMNLETLSYLYKIQKDNKRSLGLIAQDVEAIYPELVTYNKESDVYHLNYSGFGVIAIKAIQELKKEVKTLQTENTQLKEKLNKLEELEARLTALENSN